MRLGIDIGGTFTDAMLVDADGRLHSFKVPSTPGDPGEGFMHAIDRARDVVAFDRDGLAQLAHATTVATNAIFEGKAARVALVIATSRRRSSRATAVSKSTSASVRTARSSFHSTKPRWSGPPKRSPARTSRRS
jgi:hypothetical protein